MWLSFALAHSEIDAHMHTHISSIKNPQALFYEAAIWKIDVLTDHAWFVIHVHGLLVHVAFM